VRRKDLAALANTAAARSRRIGAPLLRPDSDADTIAEWLQWNDPNGAHTAELALAEDMDPYDLDSAWEALEQMLADDLPKYTPNRSDDLAVAQKIRETFVDRKAERRQEVPWKWPRSMREVGRCEAVMYSSDKWQKGRGRNWLEDYKHIAEGMQWVLVRPGFLQDGKTRKALDVVGPEIDLHPMPSSFAVLADVLGVQMQFYMPDGAGDEYYLPNASEDTGLYEVAIGHAKLGAGQFPDTGETFLIVYTPAGVEMLIVGEKLAVEKDGIVG